MKQKLQILSVLLLSFLSSYAQPLTSLGTANTIAKGQIETGIFSPFRLGITHSTELQSFIPANYKLPNIGIKQYWFTPFWDIKVATKHSIYYPTPMIRNPLLARFFTIPDSFHLAPPTFAFRNEIIFSKMLKKKTICEAENYLLSVKLGLANAKVFGEDSLIPNYDKHLLYPRTSIFKDTILWYVGADLEGHLAEKMDFFIDLEFMSVDWDVKLFALEHKAGMSYFLNEKTKVWLGYKAVYGNYPSPSRFFISPIIDFTFHFTKPKLGREKGLFKKKMF